MVQSVELVLDEASEAAVRRQWAALGRTDLDKRPHITVGVAREIWPRIEANLAALSFEPFGVRVGALALFGGARRSARAPGSGGTRRSGAPTGSGGARQSTHAPDSGGARQSTHAPDSGGARRSGAPTGSGGTHWSAPGAAPRDAPGGVIVVRLVVPTPALLDVQHRVHAVVGGCPGVPDTMRPGDWTPHVTLARRVPAEQLPEMLAGVLDEPDIIGTVVGIRRWDGDNRREWRIA